MPSAIASAVVGYLGDEDRKGHRHWVVEPLPVPRRSVGRLSRSWPLVLRLPGIDEPWRAAGLSALTDVRDGGSVDRALLQDWARAVDHDCSDRNLVRLWIAVRVWGGHGRFGPHNVRLGFTDPRLTDSLRGSAVAILGRPLDLAVAFTSFQVRGTNVSYSSKWFWAISLGKDDVAQRPLILDRRVKETLKLIAAFGGVPWSEPSGLRGYLEYVARVHDAASLVQHQLPHTGAEYVDGEKVEWLLFDRRPYRSRGVRRHTWTDEQCLVDWLRRRAGGSAA